MSKNGEIKVSDALRILCMELEIKLDSKLQEANAIKMAIGGMKLLFGESDNKASPKPSDSVKLDNPNERKIYSAIGTGNSIQDIQKKSKVAKSALYSGLQRLRQKKLIKKISFGIYARTA